GKLSLASTYLQRSLVAATHAADGQHAAQSGEQRARGWEVAMRRIGATPLPGTKSLRRQNRHGHADRRRHAAPRRRQL
ncbi:hypothetical protein ACFFYR_08035, partial [Paraburkholderia dipogonis]|uniref:hypothetical protein n=1 Tax=Paraburkholderia dipogonis TaxID=1211383 RepID=UPI0035ECEE03